MVKTREDRISVIANYSFSPANRLAKSGGGIDGDAEQPGRLRHSFGRGHERILVPDREDPRVRPGHDRDQLGPPAHIVPMAGHGEVPGHLVGWLRPAGVVQNRLYRADLLAGRLLKMKPFPSM